MSEASRVNLYLRAENRLIFGAEKNRPLPVTIVTGFLGAGKTTLMRHILGNKYNLRVAAAVNDFAELNIDSNLVANLPTGTTGKVAEKVVELSNGCVCCTLRRDLEGAVWKMLKEDVDVGRIEYLVIETSGITDPSSIIRSLDKTFGKMYRARLDSVVTVLDAEQYLAWVPDEKGKVIRRVPQVALSQLQCADVVMINKMDLVGTEDLERLKDYIEETVPGVTTYVTNYSKIGLEKILDVSLADNSSTKQHVSHEASQQAYVVSAQETISHTSRHRDSKREKREILKKKGKRKASGSHSKSEAHDHLANDKYDTFTFKSSKPLSLKTLEDFCYLGIPASTVRMKGVLWIKELADNRCVLHLSGRRRLHFRVEGNWNGPPETSLVAIGHKFDQKTLQSSLRSQSGNDSGKVKENVLNRKEDQKESISSIADEVKEKMFAKDSPFKLIKLEEKPGVCSFRLTGERVFGMNELELRTAVGGVDFNRLNLFLVDAYNADAKGLLSYLLDADNHVILLSSLHKNSPIMREWSRLVTHAKNILDEQVASRMSVCKCD